MNTKSTVESPKNTKNLKKKVTFPFEITSKIRKLMKKNISETPAEEKLFDSKCTMPNVNSRISFQMSNQN